VTSDERHTGADDLVVRPIRHEDDGSVAAIIRDVMTEFFCNRAGFAIHDAEVDAMTQAYAAPGSEFYVVERERRVLGCGGFGPLAGLAPSERTCELRKMYYRKELRGRGAGERLLRHLLARMVGHGYRRCYLETTDQMAAARRLYERLGFVPIERCLGATGHHGCNRYYVRDLDAKDASLPTGAGTRPDA
jgi:putative acetyltransferase